MTLRRQLKRIEEGLRGTLESFVLLDGTRYYYSRLVLLPVEPVEDLSES
jgi:hypothetical protein